MALQDLLAQHAVGLPQRGRAAGYASLQFFMRFAPFQRSLHVLGHIAQQLAVVLGVVGVLAIALHHDAAHHASIAQQWHAQPVLAHWPQQHEAALELLSQLGDGAHDGLAALQQVPGEAVAHLLQCHCLIVRGRLLVHGVDVVRKTHRVGGRVVQRDVEIFRVHQAAENGVQRMHHLGHVVLGARLVGDSVKRTLQPFGQGQPRDRLVQSRGFGELAQACCCESPQPGEMILQRVRRRLDRQIQH